jgi:hypothetical protein
MNTNTNKLRQRIMRRVYYTFALRIVRHQITTQVALFALALVVFAKLVHVSRIAESLLSTPLGNVPQYIFNVVFHALLRGEVLTLIAVGVMVFVALSLPLRVVKTFVPQLHTRALV